MDALVQGTPVAAADRMLVAGRPESKGDRWLVKSRARRARDRAAARLGVIVGGSRVDQAAAQALFEQMLREEIAKQRMRAAKEQLEAAQAGALEVRHTRRFRIGDARPTASLYWYWRFREQRENNRWSRDGSLINPWQDPGFVKDLVRDNPELRARREKPMDRVSFANTKSEIPNPQAENPKPKTQIPKT